MKSTHFPLTKLAAILALLGWTPPTFANPVLDQVAFGQANIQQTNNTTAIHQTSQQAIINWHSFNINNHETTYFLQPAGGVALNRINPTQGASSIYGHLTATGQIILINPAGIHFGPNAYVNVGGLVASTANITDQDFLNGIYRFSNTPGFNGAITNQGKLKAAQHGLIALIGSAISNEGLIQVDLGHVVLASGEAFTMSFAGNDLVNFSIDQKTTHLATDHEGKTLKNGIYNSGIITAQGGKILITAQATAGILDHIINMDGVTQAQSISQQHGEIILSGDAINTVKIGGKIDTSSKTDPQQGGNITITGHHILIDSTAYLDASGNTGGGNITIGGNYQGQGPLMHANATVLAKGAEIHADAITKGSGGQIILWSDDATKAYGKISATGGATSGDGGFIETSSHHYLDVNGLTVNLKAANGKTGNWLLDPADLTICSSCTTTNPISGGIFAPGAGNSNLLVTDLINALASANITVQTTSAGTGGNGDIFINTNINYNSANSLTLSAYRDITASGTNSITNSGTGNVILRADNTGTGTGTVGFASGNVTTAGNVSIYYNPVTFGTQDTIYTGGSTPIQYMLINSLGSELDTTSRSLASLSNTTAWWGENFALARDIDASLTNTWGAGTGFSPIGTIGTMFSGYFDGQNFTLSNLYINRTTAEYQGLFGRINNAVFSNLYLSGSITARNSSGLLFGQASGSGSATNIHTLAGSTVTGSTGGIGGIGGTGFMNYTNVTNAANVSSTTNTNAVGVGGIHGVGGRYTNVSNTGNITGGAGLYVGGITGYLDGGSPLTNAVNSGTINGTSTGQVGGIVGQSYGVIDSTYNIGLVTSSNGIAGGITGYNGNIITNSYNTAKISGSTAAGGIAGTSSGSTINNTFNTGMVTATSTGPITSSAAGSYANNFWDTETTGIASASVGTPTTTANMMTQANFTGFDFSTTWNMIAGQSYPYLRAFYTSTPRVFSGSTHSNNVGISLANNGTIFGNTTIGNDGSFYFLSGNNLISHQDYSIADGSNILIYAADGSGTNIFTAPTGNASLNNIAIGDYVVTLGSSDTTTLSLSNIIAAIGGLSDPNINLTILGNDITVENDIGFLTTNTTTYNLNGNITTTNDGIIEFGGTVSLAANSILQSDDSITLNSLTTAGNYSLNINAGYDATINGSIGTSSAPLASLDVTATNGINLNNSIYTSGNQTYSGLTSIGNNIALNSNVGSITFNNTVNGGYNLTVNGATGIQFIDNIGDVIPLNSLSLTGATSLLGNVVNTVASQLYNSPLTLSNPTTLSTTANNSAITINGLIGNQPLTLGGAVNNNQTFTLAGDLGTSSITVNGTTGNNTLIVNTNNATQDWILTAGNTGSLAGVAGGINFNNITNVTGGANNDNFTLTGSFNGNISGGAGTNSLTADNTANTWNITNSNSGSVTNLSGSFSSIQNLIGGNSGNTFNLLGGSVNSIVGGSGNNTLVGYSGTYNTWNISGTDTGSVTSVSHFSQIQNLTGGNSGNLFAYSNNAVITGLIDGGNLANMNTLDYSAYTSDINVKLGTGIFDGTTQANNAYITYFYQNINNLVANGNNNNALTLPNKMNTLTVTGPKAGYINDPLYFSGFNLFTALGNGNLANFNIPATVNYANSTAMIDGQTMSFINFTLGTPPTPLTPNNIPNVSGIIQSGQDMPGQIYMLSPLLPNVLIITQNIDTTAESIMEWYDARVVRVSTGPYCMTTT